MYQVAPRMLASSGSTVDSRLAATMARAPVSPRDSRVASGVGPAGAAFPPAGTAGT
jgi:hypothetical protein